MNLAGCAACTRCPAGIVIIWLTWLSGPPATTSVGAVIAARPSREEGLAVMTRPADLDAGEITGEGYVNQRQVLANRAALVELLYTEPAAAGVVVAGRTA